jgi:hypothetical protein
MTEILAFILGIGAALLVWGVVVAFKTAKKVEDLQQHVKVIEDIIIQNDELVNRRIDQEIDRTNQEVGTIYSAMDSRFDKFETRITKEKQVLKG